MFPTLALLHTDIADSLLAYRFDRFRFVSTHYLIDHAHCFRNRHNGALQLAAFGIDSVSVVVVNGSLEWALLGNGLSRTTIPVPYRSLYRLKFLSCRHDVSVGVGEYTTSTIAVTLFLGSDWIWRMPSILV